MSHIQYPASNLFEYDTASVVFLQALINRVLLWVHIQAYADLLINRVL